MAEMKFTSNPLKGIDVSAWQGSSFSLQKAKDERGAKFVILRAGGKSEKSGALFKDSLFENYYKQAVSCGMPKGAYFYGGATTTAQAIQEARYFISLLEGKTFEYPVYYDVECKAQGYLSKAALTAVVETFCKTMEKSGYFCGVYSSTSWYASEMDPIIAQHFAPWVADWRGRKPAIAGTVQMWQTGSTKNYQPGIEVDDNLCYVDNYPELIQSLGLNGYSEPAPKKPETSTGKPAKTPAEVAREVWLGEWGNGDERKKRLQDAGYDYNVVQGLVNAMKDPPKKTNEDIAREVWAGKWGNSPERQKLIEAAGYDYAAVQKVVNAIRP